MERTLENYISKRLIPKLGNDDDLMGHSGNKPISGFSAKINLAFRLGLIPATERTICHQLRELRNACAHHIDKQDFAANHFKDRTQNIIENSKGVWEAILVKIAPMMFPDEPPATVEMFVDTVGWREAFQMFFALVIAHKEASINRVSRLSALHEGTPEGSAP